VTPPLTTDEARLDEVRWRFGRALVGRYRATGLVLDLAEVISTRPDGTVCSTRGAPRLCDEYAADSGHLNAEGAARAAKAFVFALHRLLAVARPPRPRPAAARRDGSPIAAADLEA
jgi:hypothetical protein